MVNGDPIIIDGQNMKSPQFWHLFQEKCLIETAFKLKLLHYILL
jgi:hypothetical protein